MGKAILVGLLALCGVVVLAGCVDTEDSGPSEEYANSYMEGQLAWYESTLWYAGVMADETEFDEDDTADEMESKARSKMYSCERGLAALTRAEMHFDGMRVYAKTDDEKRLSELLKTRVGLYKEGMEIFRNAIQVVIDRKDIYEAERLVHEGDRYYYQGEVYTEEIDRYVRKIGLPEPDYEKLIEELKEEFYQN